MSTPPAYSNRLAREPSPYLRQHATNPVDWYPWGEEALARAKQEDKPILLSVGYSACHWCHVMAHESFEDEATAAVMNRHFINVKLDREERPDVDQLYQGVVQLMGRGGGWPLTVFLTPDLRPFFGGTYFPKTPRHGLPAFSTLLENVARAWTTERAELEQQAEAFKEGLTEFASYGLDATPGTLKADDVVSAARHLSRRVDRVHGGFGHAGPKFPNPMNVALLLRGYRRSGDPQLRTDALLTLEKMAKGGLCDHLGGGFHRYSVDERWLVPHFEKMLYDNAQLLHLYSEAFQLAPRPLWRTTVEATVAYLAREMKDEGGAFFAAQDADSEGEEGKFFVWRPEELVAVLGRDDGALVAAHFGVKDGGNFEHGASVLEVVKDAEALAGELGLGVEAVQRRLTEAKAKLLEARGRRVPPGRDDKVLAGWNGLLIRGLAFASRVFGRRDWADLATHAADFVLTKLRSPDGRLFRSWQKGAPRLDGVLEDYGDVCAGLVTLYQATFAPRFLEAAEQLADLASELFWDHTRRAYLAAPKGTGDLLVPTYALHDNAFPSGASSLTEAHVALAALTGRARHLDRAAAYLEKMQRPLTDSPMAYGHLWLAADAYLDGAAEVTLVGRGTSLDALQRVMDSTYLPTVALHRLEAGASVPAVAAEVLAERKARGDASAYLCRNFACQQPVASVDELRALLGPLTAK
ncbi:MAG: thioredoxin domain-containing protein [Myxococcota bacterium]